MNKHVKQITVNGNSLYVAREMFFKTEKYSDKKDFLHLGDHASNANGLYIGKLTRGDLYKKYSGLDYNKIDFAVPQGVYDQNNPAVTYYGESQIWGKIIYDSTILEQLAETVADLVK